MAMPASGCIALYNCISGIACSSIACAVQGTPVGSCCLSALSVAAGKTAPHTMSEFYGYYPPTPINLYTYASVGTDGVSSNLTRAYCVCPTPGIGDSYCLCLGFDMCIGGASSGSYVGVCVTCNLACKMSCCFVYGQTCAVPLVEFPVGSSDCVRIFTCVCECTSIVGTVGNIATIDSITTISGNFCRGANYTCCIHTG